MRNDFDAASVTRTELSPDGQSWIVTLVTKAGVQRTLTLTATAAMVLGSALMHERAKADNHLTKRPSEFAVGTGKYEPVVLLRFEDDLPYGLTAAQARLLGQELIEASRTLASRSERVIQ